MLDLWGETDGSDGTTSLRPLLDVDVVSARVMPSQSNLRTKLSHTRCFSSQMKIGTYKDWIGVGLVDQLRESLAGARKLFLKLSRRSPRDNTAGPSSSKRQARDRGHLRGRKIGEGGAISHKAMGLQREERDCSKYGPSDHRVSVPALKSIVGG